MKAYVDNFILEKISSGKEDAKRFMNSCEIAGVGNHAQTLEIVFGWPSFLEYIGAASVFKDFPGFDARNSLFNFSISTLSQEVSRDSLYRLYDQIFAECLTQVSAFPELNQIYLIYQIQDKRKYLDQGMFSKTLSYYEKVLKEDPYNTLHDLTLYLAWDRMCVYLGTLFDYHEHALNKEGLAIMRECLLESFQHISDQGRTKPGFFRLLEALYAYEMREENLQGHSEDDWKILSKSGTILRSRKEILDVYYIDAAIRRYEESHKPEEAIEINPICVMTTDSIDYIHAVLAFAHLTLKKLRMEIPEWNYVLKNIMIFYVTENHDKVSIERYE